MFFGVFQSAWVQGWADADQVLGQGFLKMEKQGRDF